MAGTNGKTASDLALEIEDQLLEKSRSFSFFQAVRLLKMYTGSNGKNSLSSRIRMQPNLSLSFPSSDVDNVEKKEDHYLLTANLLGLYGTCSPLPTFYTEDFFEDVDEDNLAAKNLTDVISHQMYRLLFQGWTKYKLMLKVLEDRDENYINRLFSVYGFGDKGLRSRLEDPYGTLRYSGLFAMQTRSAAGLEVLLKDNLPGTDITIEQCIERKGIIPDDQRSVLGGENGICLGVQSHMGSEYTDRTGSFRIKVSSLSEAEYRDYFPGSKNYKLILELTELYINDPLAYEIEVSMSDDVKMEPLILGGDKWSRLGLDTWLTSEGLNVDHKMRFYPDANETQMN